MTENPEQADAHKGGWTRKKGTIISAIVGFVVMAGVFFMLFPKFADYQKAFAQIVNMPLWAIGGLIIASAINIVVYPLTANAAIPHLGYRAAFNSRQVSFLISNVLPGGGPVAVATQYAVLAGYKVESVKAVAAVTADAAFMYLITLGAPSIAAILLILQGHASSAVIITAVIGLVVLLVSVAVIAVSLRSDGGAHKVGEFLQKPVNWVFRLVKKSPPEIVHHFVDFHDHAAVMVSERWKLLTLSNFAAQMAPMLVLTVAVFGLGGFHTGLNPVEVFAAYSIALLATMIPLTPGGLGTADAALVGLLTSFGADPSLAVAADLIWRIAWFLPQLVAGAGALAVFGWDRRKEALSAEVTASDSL